MLPSRIDYSDVLKSNEMIKELRMKDTQTTEQLLTADEVGNILGLSKRQVFRLSSSGRIVKPLKIVGSTRFRRSDIERWISLGCPDRRTFEETRNLGMRNKRHD